MRRWFQMFHSMVLIRLWVNSTGGNRKLSNFLQSREAILSITPKIVIRPSPNFYINKTTCEISPFIQKKIENLLLFLEVG